ncbi:hypothetical protein C8A00DRAFT_16086 [Chaetomidium leptoderma]|uniref:Uncharacterized protein n=1 Tax=Chaetomidium leptoderma TaxID=669021 RepID=A0AAN6VKQ1_9PEZI|nr:hypothetical protein C8A00DRAFT_16086 [Chaetomidium leptoderma]
MTDEELDREWKPSGRRPQSTIAQMFSEELKDIFRIDNSVADLDKEVDKRSQQINSQTSELEALEARIREMEMMLKGNAEPTTASANDQSNNKNAPPPPPAKDLQHKHAGSRPGTARQNQPAVPGALPPTPAGSEGESHPPVARLSAIVPRPPGTKAQSRVGGSAANTGAFPYSPSSSASRANEMSVPGGDSDSVKSLSESASFADYVIVPEPDGDRERDA